MKTPSLNHPTATQGLVSRRDSYERISAANLNLQNEMSQVIDSFQAADNGPADLDER